ncbi:MAG: sulfatase-like hydrolase/transferase [Bryobacteraceae bacterium]
MRRREFLTSAATGALTAELSSSRLTAGQRGVRPRANILFMIADDLTFRGIHTLNNPEVQTPNLDRLVRRGCSFTHAFHQGSWLPAVCVASRTMLNSGLTAFRARKEVDRTPLWGQTFGEAGYDTFLIGKWHLDHACLERSFKETGPVSPGMFESGPSAYGRPAPGNTWTPWDTSLKGQWLHTSQWQCAAQAQRVRRAPPSEAGTSSRRTPFCAGSLEDGIKHSARIWADGACEYLLRPARPHNPFFAYVGFNSPHDPRQAPKEFVDRYPQHRIEVPPNYLPEHPFDQGDHRIRDELLAPFPRTRAAVQLHRSEYYAHTTYMDAQIGRILDALEKSGQAGNTYIVFTADHGLAVGQHGLMGKQNMYDHSIRMPLLISGPGIPKGKIVDSLVYQHSLFATTCELAGLPIPKTVGFPSLAGLLDGRGAEQHDAIFSYYRNFQRAVRTKEHKLIVYPQARMTQLFDVNHDPWEIVNLAGKPEHAALERQLLSRLRRFQTELGDDLLPPVDATPPS